MKGNRISDSAFSLLEVTFALGIATVCLCGILGLLLVGIQSHRTSIEQTAAAGWAGMVISDIRATLKSDPSATISRQFQIPIPASGIAKHILFLKEDEGRVGAIDTDADPSLDPKYRAIIVFTPCGKAAMLRVLITWPAMADRSAGDEPVNFTGSYEAITALDRN